ncbi:MAG: hypothetical protein NPIRA02_02650 [Nitrospirales bacterium]|nr:MAG: hypothetical protein NPIRA02_02650 [Nitrospirales bacterium]
MSKAQIIWDESKPEPSWVTKIQKDDSYFYYRGSAVKAESLELGEKAARQNAYSQVTEYLNTTLESVYEGKTTDYDQDLKDIIKAKSAGLVKKAEVIDSYHKKMTRIDKGYTLERYDVHVLVRYPKSEAEAERKRQEAEVKNNLSAAYELYQKGKGYEATGNYQQSRRFSQEALKILEKVPGAIPLDKGNISNSRELETLLRTQEQNAIRNLRRVMVWVQEPSLGKGHPRSPLSTRVKAILNNHNFTVLDQRTSATSRSAMSDTLEGDKQMLMNLKQKGVQYLVAGKVSTIFSSTTLNQHIFDAQGSLRVIGTKSGDTILTIPIHHRGNHREKTRARLHALEEAGNAVGKTLVNELLAREDQ